MAVHYDIQLKLLKILQAASFKGLPPENIKVGILPKVGENLDNLPCIIIAPYGKTSWEPASFENSNNFTYYVEATIVVENRGDYRSKQQQYADWGDLVGGLISPTNFDGLECPSVWSIDLVNSPNFDRSKLNQQYVYLSSVGKYTSQEPRRPN